MRTAQEAIATIRQEIERRAELNTTQFKKGLISVETLTARDSQLLGLNTFLDSLSVDAPEGLGEAIKSYVTPRLDKEYVAYGEHRQKQLSKFDAYDLEAAIEFGAEWAFGQGETVEGFIAGTNQTSAVLAIPRGEYVKGDKVIVQIRKK